MNLERQAPILPSPSPQNSPRNDTSLGELTSVENLPEHLQEVIRRYISEHGGDPFSLPRIDPQRFAMLLHDTRRMLFEGSVSKPRTLQEFIVARQMLEFLESNLEYVARVYPGKAQRIRDVLLELELSHPERKLRIPSAFRVEH